MRDQPQDLQDRDQRGNVTNVTTMDPDVGLAVSRAKSRDELSKAANAVGYTLPALAKAVSELVGRSVTVSQIKMARRGERPIGRDVAEAIQSLTQHKEKPKGFEAVSRNWKLIQD